MTPGDRPTRKTPPVAQRLDVHHVARRIRDDLKARFGFCRDHVSVHTAPPLFGVDRVTITLKVPGFPLRRLDRLVSRYRLDSREITAELAPSVYTPHVAAVLAVVRALPAGGPSEFRPVRFGRYRFLVARLVDGGAETYRWSAGGSLHTGSASALAEDLARRLVQSRQWQRLLDVPRVSEPPPRLGLFSPSLLTSLQRRLELVAIAEAELSRALELYPQRRAQLLRGARAVTTPSGLSAEGPPWWYRAHCRELLERLADGGDPTAATVAELAAGLAAVHERSTPSPAAAALEASLTLQAAFLGDLELSAELRRELEGTRAAAEAFEAEDLLKILARRLADPRRRPSRSRGASRFVQLELPVAA